MTTKISTGGQSDTNEGGRAIGYLRVSTAGQEERGSSLASQRERVREHAGEQGLVLIDVVHESGSGAVREGELCSVEHRPVLQSLLDRAQQGDFDALVVLSYDRLSRDQIDAALLKRWFSKYGVRCVSASGESNGAEGPFAELIDRVLGAIHDFERRRILERVATGKAKRKREGRHVHGSVPYGYRSIAAPDGQGRTLQPVDDTAPVVRRIFADAKASDAPGRIATALNRDGIPGPRRVPWTPRAVRGIIENVAYAGERYGVKRAHPAIVTRQLWNAANAQLASRARS